MQRSARSGASSVTLDAVLRARRCLTLGALHHRAAGLNETEDEKTTPDESRNVSVVLAYFEGCNSGELDALLQSRSLVRHDSRLRDAGQNDG